MPYSFYWHNQVDEGAKKMKKYYIGLKNKVWIISETEDSYTFTSVLEGQKANQIAFDPENQKRIYVATDSGLYKTEDGGDTWAHADEGIESQKVTTVAVHPSKRVNDNSIVMAGTEPSSLYYSEDNGDSWQEYKGVQDLPSKQHWAFPPRPDTHFVRWITTSFGDDGFIGVSIESGAVIHTNNNGKTWNDRIEGGPIDVHTMLTHPDAPARIYAANGDGAANPKRAYAESHDGGQTWVYMSEGLEDHPYLYNLVLHPIHPDYRLVSGSKSASKAHRDPKYSTVYRKIGDEPWVELAEGLPKKDAFTHYLANDPNHVDVFYALNNFGLYRMETADEVWKEVDISWPDGNLGERPYFFAIREE